MKSLFNKCITIGITCSVSALVSAGIISITLFGGIAGELILPSFVISFLGNLVVGTPISLLIHHNLRSNKTKGHVIRFLLHVISGGLIVLLLSAAQGKEVFNFNDFPILFFISGIINSIVYNFVFTLLKATGDTGFE